MSILAILLVIAAFCVMFWVCRALIKPPWQITAYIIWAVLLVLFLLWQAGALGFLTMRVGHG